MKILRKVIVTIISFIISCFGGDAASYTADSTFLNKLYYKNLKEIKSSSEIISLNYFHQVEYAFMPRKSICR